MKPLKITLKNIGPFREETIDFEKLGDMFLVCGNTGAGKSTIFDAMTYALYGSLPGIRKSQPKFLRSDFCPADEDSVVIFEYMIHGKHLKVMRTMSRDVVTKRGTTKQKPEEVVLAEIHGGFESPILANKSELDKMIVDELDLDAGEFSRIVLLPQGEFAEFLRQNSRMRKETLTKLFPISLYDSIIKKTKANRDNLQAQHEIVMNHLKENFSSDYNEEKEAEAIQLVSQKIATLENKQKELQKEQTSYIKKQTQLKNKLEKFEEAEKLRELQQQYEELRPNIEAKQKKLDTAIKAEPAAIASENYERAQKSLEAEKKSLADNISKKNEAQNAIEKLKEQNEEIETLKAKNESNLVLLKQLEDAATAQTQLQTLLAEEKEKSCALQQNTDEIQKLESEISAIAETLETLEKEKGDIDFSELTEKSEEARASMQTAEKQNESAIEKAQAETEITKLEKELSSSNEQSQSLSEQISQSRAARDAAKNKSLAQILASELTEGTPCPVCGATHHPAISHSQQLTFDAQLSDKTENFSEQIKSLDQKISDLENDYNDLQGKISFTKNLISQNKQKLEKLENIPSKEVAQKNYEEAKLNFENISAMQKNLAKKMKDISDTTSTLEKKRKIIEPLIKRQQDVQISLADTRAKISNLSAQIKTALETSEKHGFISQTASEAATLARKTIAAAKTRIANFEAAFKKAESSLADAEGGIKQLQQSVKNRENEKDEAATKLRDALTAAGFSTAEEAVAARLDAKISATFKKEIEDWRNGLTATNARLESAEKELEDVPKNISAEYEAVNIELEKIKTENEDARIILTKIVTDKVNMENKLQDWKQNESKRKVFAEKFLLAKKLYDDISGDNNPRHTSISAWILGIYFAEITKYASKRLQRISDGRYTLFMKEEVGPGNTKQGLDLEILDAYTGKRRPCNTLSGGETFMASISLALALTDVVSNRAGGITLDSLFIDEGFGSLDEMSLEKAISILDEIRGTRCIGIISHVAELRKRIPVHLEVKKTSTGSMTHVVFDEDAE